MKKVRIVYFSGTGGTRMVAGELAARITQHGGSVSGMNYAMMQNFPEPDGNRIFSSSVFRYMPPMHPLLWRHGLVS